MNTPLHASWPVVAATCTAAGLAALMLAHTHTPLYHHARRGPPAPGHAESFAIGVVIRQRPLGASDSYSTTIPLSRLRPGVTDREILARFVGGFFGGPVFAPESWGLALSGGRLTDVDAISAAVARFSHKSGDGFTIAQTRDSTPPVDGTPPAVGSLFSGTFLVLDSSYQTQPKESGGAVASYIDIVYGGGERSSISGSHRFQVTRQGRPSARGDKTARGGDQEAVVITFSSVTDLDGTDSLLGRCIFAFHTLYSHLLFSDGIRRVLGAQA